MNDFKTTIDAWKMQLNHVEDDCPWTGPRPYISELDDGKRPFTGRDTEIVDVITKIRDNALVILHGDSAVGKTSFVNMGLRPAMRRYGFRPIICSSWTAAMDFSFVEPHDRDLLKPSDLDGVDDYLRRVISENVNLNPKVRADIESKGVMGSLHTWVKTPVLVLDQFEEFLRSANESANESYMRITGVFRWIEYVTKNYSANMKVLLSLRSDSYAHVQPLEHLVNAHSFSVIELSPVSDEFAVRAICNGSYAPAYKDKVKVDDDVADSLFEQWKAQPTASSMFDLQAKLYALYWLGADNCNNESVQIDQSVWDLMTSFSDNKDVVKGAFSATFTYKLRHCREGFRLTAQDSESGNPASQLPVDTLTNLIEDHIRLMVPHLSTESFKERRTLWELFELSHPREIGNLIKYSDEISDYGNQPFNSNATFQPLKLAPEQAGGNKNRSEIESVMRWLWLGPKDEREKQEPGGLIALRDDSVVKNPPSPYLLAGTVNEALAYVGAALTPIADSTDMMDGVAIDHLPWLEDPDDLSGGAMLGCQPAEVMVQFIRSYLLAISWLGRSYICRVTNDSIHLIHDQLGEALKTWASTLTSNPMSPLVSLTAVIGDRFHWVMPDVRPDMRPDMRRGWVEPKDTPYIVNSRVQRSWIDRVHFANAIFVNCDFRMTRFRDCAFENVLFVNCVMDGVFFDGCEVIGIPDPKREILDSVLSDSMIEEIYKDAGAPDFWTDEADNTLATLTYFRSSPVPDDPILYSLTSGIAATCVSRSRVVRPDENGCVKGKIPHLDGGLTILGGRISGLTVRDCTFSEERQGEIAIAYAAGSSIDFVEQRELRVYVLGSALRGFSVSRRINDREPLPADAIRIEAQDSQFAGPWFSQDLSGSIQFDENCSVWGECILSPKEQFETPGLLLEREMSEKPDSWREQRDAKQKLMPAKTDYRSRVAEYEIRRRINAGRNGRVL